MSDYVVIANWDEPETGVAAWGPYKSAEEATEAIPNIKPYLVNPFSSQEERDETEQYLKDLSERYPGSGDDWLELLISAEDCKDMGYEWGGQIPDDVVITVVHLNN